MGVSVNTSQTEPAEGPDPAAPLIIVGSARSGSSLLTLMLNRGAGGFIVNDAYVAQMAEAMALGKTPDARRLAEFRTACLARIGERSVVSGEAPIHRSAVADEAALARAGGAEGETWTGLWADMACRAADRRRLWGWNTPQDFTRAEELLAAYPRARFLFLVRDPYSVLRSYKNLPDYWGREARRYHPVLQAWAWRRAVRTYEALVESRPERVGLVRYEQLVADPAATLRRLGDYLGVPMASVDPRRVPGNGSSTARGLTRAEIWAARLVLGDAPARFGYAAPDAGRSGAEKGAGSGALELLRLSFRAGGYYLREAARSPDMRGRIRRLVGV